MSKKSKGTAMVKFDPALQKKLGDLAELQTNVYMARYQFLKQAMDPRRDIDRECGYPDTLELRADKYWRLYEREPYAARVVELMPRECWQGSPEVYEDEDPDNETEFEQAWDRLCRQLRPTKYKGETGSVVWEYLQRADELSGVGSFGIVLIGLDDGLDLSAPVKGMPRDGIPSKTGQGEAASYDEYVASSSRGTEEQYWDWQSTSRQGEDEDGDDDSPQEEGDGPRVTYLRVFGEQQAVVTQFESSPLNPRYGQPVMYQITLNDPRDAQWSGVGLPTNTANVHWTRVVHLADNLSSSEVFGVSRLRSVLNPLLDIVKVRGGSAEMYWQGALPGWSFETHPQLGPDVDIDRPRLKDMMEAYQNGLSRFFDTSGMSAKSLAPQVVDPTSQILTQVQAICVKLGCPQRVFMGSERGELASSQDDAAWNDRVRFRQNGYVTPRVIAPFVDRLICLGVLPVPESYKVRWPKLDSLSGMDKANIAATQTQTINTYASGAAQSIVPPREFLTEVMGWEDELADSVLEAADEHAEELADQQAQMGGQIDPGQPMGPPQVDPETGEPMPQPQPGGQLPPGGGPPTATAAPGEEEEVPEEEAPVENSAGGIFELHDNSDAPLKPKDSTVPKEEKEPKGADLAMPKVDGADAKPAADVKPPEAVRQAGAGTAEAASRVEAQKSTFNPTKVKPPVENAFDESKIKRDDDGKFADKGGTGGGGGKKRVYHEDPTPAVKERFKAALGKDLTPDAAGDLVGAGEGYKISVLTTSAGNVVVKAYAPDFRANMVRTLEFYGKRKECHNDIIKIRGTGTGLGTDIFSAQVKALQEAGFKKITCFALRSDDPDPEKAYTGYAVWPKLGYDYKFSVAEKLKLPGIANKLTVRSIQELLRRPWGEAWWRENGWSLPHCEFDLTPGSNSLKVLDAYLQKKGKRTEFKVNRLISQDEARGAVEFDMVKHPDWDMSPDDEAALREVWDTLREEQAGADHDQLTEEERDEYAELVEQYEPTANAFDESKINRDEQGQFSSKPGTSHGTRWTSPTGKDKSGMWDEGAYSTAMRSFLKGINDKHADEDLHDMKMLYAGGSGKEGTPFTVIMEKKGKGILGILSVAKDGGGYLHNVTLHPSLRGKKLAVPFYKHAFRILGMQGKVATVRESTNQKHAAVAKVWDQLEKEGLATKKNKNGDVIRVAKTSDFMDDAPATNASQQFEEGEHPRGKAGMFAKKGTPKGQKKTDQPKAPHEEIDDDDLSITEQLGGKIGEGANKLIKAGAGKLVDVFKSIFKKKEQAPEPKQKKITKKGAKAGQDAPVGEDKPLGLFEGIADSAKAVASFVAKALKGNPKFGDEPYVDERGGGNAPSPGKKGKDTSKLWRPGKNPTVDAIVTRDDPKTGKKQVLLIKRGDSGQWALPGGFHDSDAPKGKKWKPGKETAEEAVLRELHEEAGVDVKKSVKKLKKVGEYGKTAKQAAARDPRNTPESWTSSTAFKLHLPPSQSGAKLKSGSDAKGVKWVNVDKLHDMELAFDHGDMLADAGVKSAMPKPKPGSKIGKQPKPVADPHGAFKTKAETKAEEDAIKKDPFSLLTDKKPKPKAAKKKAPPKKAAKKK